MLVARVAELWRYPVKGMRGETVSQLEADAYGIRGDRRFAFMSSGAPAGKPMLTGRERAAMLLYQARMLDGQVHMETSQGERFRVEDPACAAALQAALPQGHRIALQHADTPLTDCRPISVLSLQAVHAFSKSHGRPVDARRFRANIVLSFDGEPADSLVPPEDLLVRHRIRIGDAAQLRITERDPRCRIVTLDPETAEQDAGLMKHLDRYFQGRLGVYATAVVPGVLHVGDPVYVECDEAGSVTFPALPPSKQG